MESEHPLLAYVRAYPWHTSLLIAAGDGDDVTDLCAEVMAERAADRPPSAQSPRVRTYLFYEPDRPEPRPAISEHFSIFGLSIAEGVQHWKVQPPAETCGRLSFSPDGQESVTCGGLTVGKGQCSRGHAWQPSGTFVGGNMIDLLVVGRSMTRFKVEKTVDAWTRKALAPRARVWLDGERQQLAKVLSRSRSLGLELLYTAPDGCLLARRES